MSPKNNQTLEACAILSYGRAGSTGGSRRGNLTAGGRSVREAPSRPSQAVEREEFLLLLLGLDCLQLRPLRTWEWHLGPVSCSSAIISCF